MPNPTLLADRGAGDPAGAAGERRHTAVVDLGFGDAGKGTVVDWLCNRGDVHAVVRFNGGAQAAHNVVTADGRHHTFAQFGSGTLSAAPSGRVPLTYLSRFMLVEPLALAGEAAHLRELGVVDPLALLRVDREALLTTPYHAAANRARERARGRGRHGSCGIGIGETVAWSLAQDAPRVGDVECRGRLVAKLAALRDAVAAEHAGLVDAEQLPAPAVLADAYAGFADRVRLVDRDYLGGLLAAGRVVFEGAQGVLLDEWRGFHPHTTWSTTTTENVTRLVADAGADPGEVAHLGVLRCYTTRHGAGPLVTEDPALAGLLPEPHNGTGAWQGSFRVGHFDAVAHRYALEVAGRVDALALTHLDVAARCPRLRIAEAYATEVGTVRTLRPGPARDLGYQERLTGLLHGARPVYAEPMPVEPGRRGGPGWAAGAWVARVQDQLGVPVALTSTGPTCRDKQQLVPVSR